MKTAAMRDHWNALGKVLKPSNGIARLVQRSSQAISLQPDGVFAVVGLNGSGKSSFFHFLSDSSYAGLSFLDHEAVLENGTSIKVPGEVVSAVIVDPIAELKRSNDALAQFKSTFGQNELSAISRDELGLFNYVVGSYYSEIQIEEVETGTNGEISPRFVATVAGRSFDNEALSLGEQLILYIFWVLTKKYRSPGIFFIEEPESGLAPRAQMRISDLLVYIASRWSKQLFLSTHSPFIVSRLGSNRVLLMKKDCTATWVNSGDSNYLEELGMELGKQGTIFVEDNKAKVFLEKLLDVYGSILRKTYDIIHLGGESPVYEVVSRVANKEQGLKYYGVLDADQRGVARYKDFPDYFFFLPGTKAPEEELIIAVVNDPVVFATGLSTNVEKVKNGLRLARSLNHHDFFEELSKYLYGEVRITVYETAFKVWLTAFPDRQSVHEFIRKVDTNVGADNIAQVDEIFPLAPVR